MRQVLLLAFFWLTLALPVEAATLVVDPAGGGYKRIQEAVDRARPGDLILVRAGEYPERVRVEGKHDLTIRGLEAIIVGNGFRAGSVREVPRGFELAPDVSNIVIEGFVFRDMPWGVMVASIREKKTFASSFRATDRGIVLRYNTFVRVGLAVGACGPVTIEASILASDLHDVYDCSAPSSITIRASRLSSTAQRGRAILRRVDTRVDVSGELVDPPQFVDEKANDFRLKAESTCRRAGPGGGEIGAYGLPALRPPAEVVLPLPPFGLPSPSPVLVGE